MKTAFQVIYLSALGWLKKQCGNVHDHANGEESIIKIENIIREEMDAKDAQELLMPALIPEEVYIQSGRREAFGSNMFALKTVTTVHMS